MKFIEVTNAYDKPVFINVAHIIKVYEENEYTVISIKDDKSTTTKHSYNEVILLIKNAK